MHGWVGRRGNDTRRGKGCGLDHSSPCMYQRALEWAMIFEFLHPKLLKYLEKRPRTFKLVLPAVAQEGKEMQRGLWFLPLSLPPTCLTLASHTAATSGKASCGHKMKLGCANLVLSLFVITVSSSSLPELADPPSLLLMGTASSYPLLGRNP